MTNNRYFKFLIIAPLFLLCSCSEIVDNIEKNRADENYVSPYMGKWVGAYSGEVGGTLILNVSKSGSVEVTRTAGDVTEVYYTGFQGSDGALSPSTSPKGFILYGNLHTKSGTWKLQNWSGSWSVTKQ